MLHIMGFIVDMLKTIYFAQFYCLRNKLFHNCTLFSNSVNGVGVISHHFRIIHWAITLCALYIAHFVHFIFALFRFPLHFLLEEFYAKRKSIDDNRSKWTRPHNQWSWRAWWRFSVARVRKVNVHKYVFVNYFIDVMCRFAWKSWTIVMVSRVRSYAMLRDRCVRMTYWHCWKLNVKHVVYVDPVVRCYYFMNIYGYLLFICYVGCYYLWSDLVLWRAYYLPRTYYFLLYIPYLYVME